MSKLLTLKEIIGQAQIEVGIAQAPPATVIASLDQDIAQMASLLAAVADEVLGEPPYKIILGDGIWCQSAAGEPRPLGPQADTDRILFDGRLAINGVKMRFRAAKGLEFGEDLRDYSTRLARIATEQAPVIDIYEEEGREI
jgi:hypothetical protein